MKRPAVLIVGAVAGALLVAGVGASAHSGLLGKSVGMTSGAAGEEASGPRVEPSESPEPTETPEAQPTAEPTETPEAADTDNQDEDNNDQGDNETGDHESSGSTTGGGEHGD